MDRIELEEILDKIEIAPWYRQAGWIVETIKGGYTFRFDAPEHRFRLEYFEPDVDTKEINKQYGRWWYVEKDMPEEAVIKTAWLALTVSDEHRRREGFSYNGVRIFDPHQPLRKD